MAKIKVPFNPIFKVVHESKKRYIAMKGSAGSGKSVDTAQTYILRLMKDKGRNLLVLRKSEVTNRDSTFAELIGAINRLGVVDYWVATTSPLKLTCVNGNSIIFRGMNDDKQREKLKSITFAQGKLTDVWFEEATEFTHADFRIVDDRLRGKLPKGLFYQIKLTFNPVSARHWIKKTFFDKDSAQILAHESTYLDNRFIDDEYHRMMQQVKIDNPEHYKVYGLGEWGETEGLIFENYTIRSVQQNFEHYDDIALGQDFGFNHANAILLLGYRDGDIYVLKELYHTNRDSAQIIELAEGDLPKEKLMYCDSAEPDRIRMWRRAGYRAQPVSKEQGSVLAQIDWIKQRHIYIDESCVNLVREITQYKWKKDNASGEYLDEPVSYEDDAIAALRYGIEGWRKPTGQAGVQTFGRRSRW